MKYLLCQLVLMISSVVSGTFITYDYGTLTMILFSAGQLCFNESGSDIYSQTVRFHGTFARAPQIIILSNQYNMSYANAEFALSIPEINQENCTFQIQCFQVNPVYKIIVQWLAVDDNRITVINKFNVTPVAAYKRQFTFDHTNTYADRGFVSIVNFGFQGNSAYLGCLDLFLEIKQITSTQVTVELSQGTSTTQVGFQIIIATQDAFDISNLYIHSNLQLASLRVSQQQGQKVFVSVSKLLWQRNDTNMTLNITITETDRDTYYYLQTQSVFKTFGFQRIWLNLENYRVLVPMLCQNWRVSKKQDYTDIQIELFVKETKKLYTYSQTINFDDTYFSLNFQISISCSSVQKVKGYAFFCPDCLNQNKDIEVYCYGGMNLLQFNLKFIQVDQVYQQLLINLTSTSITIIQIKVLAQTNIVYLELMKQ